MNKADIANRLDALVTQLVPIAGTLMALACEQNFEHLADCNCRLCRAFLATQDVQNKLEQIIKELKQHG